MPAPRTATVRVPSDATDVRASDSDEFHHDRLFTEVYAELAGMARRLLGGRQRLTLDSAALVHELYLKLKLPPGVRDRSAFMALAGKAMRHVLIDYVRQREAAKRGGQWLALTLHSHDIGAAESQNQVDLLSIERCLRLLEELDPAYVTLVECRFYAGMENAEIAELLGVSMINVRVRLHRARASLRRRLVGELGNALAEVFHCDGERSLRLTGAVLAHVRAPALKAAG